MSRDVIYAVQNDTEMVVVHELVLDDILVDLTDATVECHMHNIDTNAVIDTATVTPDADQTTHPGRIATEFGATELADVAEYTLEWEATFTGGKIRTFPGKSDVRPRLIVRKEKA